MNRRPSAAGLARLGAWRRWRAGARRVPVVSIAIIAVITVCALVPSLLAPHEANTYDLGAALTPPAWLDGGSWQHVLGTDAYGRDVLSRMVYGARYAGELVLLSIVVGGFVGALVGVVSGYYGGVMDAILMRITDVALALPLILIALVLAAARGPSFSNQVIVTGFLLWARFARQVRTDVLSIKTRGFVLLARTAGRRDAGIVWTHVVRHIANTFLVLAALNVGIVIIFASSLSYLGVGIPPPAPDWGLMVADGQGNITTAWWISLFPGLAIMVTVLAASLLADWLRDTLDPRLRDRP